MAQYDLLLTQNVHATLTEYSEKFVNVAKGGLISAIADQTPTVLAGGTDGYVLVRDDAELTGLNWVDISTLGVSVANQANDRIVTATAVTDDLNAEQYLTYNTSQGLLIGSGLGIVFTAAATTYQIYTPASAFTASIAIITGTNSAAGAGDITLKAGDGISAGGNVYFQRDTTYGNFYFGTGATSHIPEAATGTHGVVLASSVGLVSESSDLHWDVASITLTLDSPSANIVVGSSDNTYIGSDRIGWEYTVGHYYRIVRAGVVMRWDYSTTSNYTAFSSPIYVDGSNTYLRLQWDTVLDATKILYLDGVAGDTRVYDSTGDLTFRDASNTGGVTLSSLVSGAAGGNVTSTTNGEDRIAYFTATADDIEGSENFEYDGSKVYLLTASASDTGQSEGIHIHQYGNNIYPGKLNFVKQRSTGSTALDNDKIGTITFQFFNDAGVPEVIVGAGISAQVIDASDAVEDVELSFWQYEAGSLTTYTLSGIFNGLFTQQTGYVMPSTSGDSIRTDGTTGTGIYVSTAYATGFQASGTSGSQMDLYTGNVNTMSFYNGWTGINVPLQMTHATPRVELNCSSPGSNAYFQTGDDATFDTDNVVLKSGDSTLGGSGEIYIYSGSAATTRGSLYFGDGSTVGLTENASATHVVSVNTTTGLLQYTAVGDVGGSSPWQVNANVITTTTAGDDILLAATEQLRFAATNQYIVGVTGFIDVYVGTGQSFRFADPTGTSVTYADILAGGTGIDLGDTGGNPFNSVAADRYYVAVIGTYIDVSGTDMTFTSVAAGTVNLADIGTGDGSVTAVNNGNGMNFTNITTSGTVTLGVGGSVTGTSTNAVSTSSHTHALVQSGIGTESSTVSTVVRRNASGDIQLRLLRQDYTTTSTNCSYFLTQNAVGTTASAADNYARPSTAAQVAAKLDGETWTFTGNNNQTSGSLQFYDNVEVELGSSNDYSLFFSANHLYFDGISAVNDIYFRTVTTTKFLFDMGTAAGTATDWIATSDVRLKKNIQPFDMDMDKFGLLASKARRYNWNNNWMTENRTEIGFIAQDVEAIYPEFVHIQSEKPNLRGLSYAKMVTLAIVGASQAWDAVVAVKSEVDILKERIIDLETDIKILQDGKDTDNHN